MNGAVENDVFKHPWDAVSLSLVAFAGYPTIALMLTGDPKYVWFALGVLGAEAATSLAKDALRAGGPGLSLVRRPAGAADCDIMNRTGPCAGAAGMPSGHMSTLAFFFAYAWAASLAAGVPAGAFWSCAALVCALVAASRLAKRCHTPEQVLAGTALGGALALGWKALGARIGAI